MKYYINLIVVYAKINLKNFYKKIITHLNFYKKISQIKNQVICELEI